MASLSVLLVSLLLTALTRERIGIVETILNEGISKRMSSLEESVEGSRMFGERAFFFLLPCRLHFTRRRFPRMSFVIVFPITYPLDGRGIGILRQLCRAENLGRDHGRQWKEGSRPKSTT